MAGCNPNDPIERNDQVTRRQTLSLTAITDRNGIIPDCDAGLNAGGCPSADDSDRPAYPYRRSPWSARRRV